MKKLLLAVAVFFAAVYFGWKILLSVVQEHKTSETKTIETEEEAITASAQYPGYWHYRGEDILLLGGSSEDNLFQAPNLEAELDLLQHAGGNYVRNTMSSRDSLNEWPFAQQPDGQYDLDRWNEVYWARLDNFLQQTARRHIVVQLEVWATFDFYREPWDANPFNPKNNINYSAGRVHLPEQVTSHPVQTENNFFRSVPSLESNLKLLEYQQKFVDQLLRYTLPHNHVLYCMDNETSVSAEWGKFWSEYIQKKARENNKQVHTTEMWDPWDLNHVVHRETLDHPELYSFVDISQNNHNSGDSHWKNGIAQMDRLKKIDAFRPVNNVKVYGRDGGKHHSTRNGIECFVRNVLMGCASTRFHRPTSGLGLSDTAQSVIKSMRSLAEKTRFVNGRPDNTILGDRQENEAFCRVSDDAYIIYFTNGGEVTLRPDDLRAGTTIQWLDILNTTWTEPVSTPTGDPLAIASPADGHWICLIRK
jgi:hypothetical protein